MISDLSTPLGGKRVGSMGRVLAKAITNLEKEAFFLFVLLRLGTKVIGIQNKGSETILETTKGAVSTRLLVNCGGLHSDRVAILAGAKPDARIVPFRGEYYELNISRRTLC